MNYQKIYDCLITRSKFRTIDGYTERHHIIPKCMGGSDDPENIAILTAEEHYLAHLLLVKIYPNVDGLVMAAHKMTSNSPTQKRSKNKLYGWLKRRFAEAIGNQKRGKPLMGLVDHTMYTWYHDDYPAVTCSRHYLKTLYPELKLDTHELKHVITGHYKHCKGWRITIDKPVVPTKPIVVKVKKRRGVLFHTEETKEKIRAANARRTKDFLRRFVDETVYEWFNPKIGYETACRYDLAEKYNLKSDELGKVVNSKYNITSHRGWTLVSTFEKLDDLQKAQFLKHGRLWCKV